MGDPLLAEVTMFAGTFAPVGWAMCDGQVLPIDSNAALYSILGDRYGGDGTSTFALPDLKAYASGSGEGVNFIIATQGLFPPPPEQS